MAISDRQRSVQKVIDVERFGWNGEGFLFVRGDAILGQVGYGVRHDVFWLHSWLCEEDSHVAAALFQAIRKEAKAQGFTQIRAWGIPPLTSTLKMVAKGRVKLEYIELSMEV